MRWQNDEPGSCLGRAAQFVEKRTLGTPALAQHVSNGAGELTLLEVNNDAVGVVLYTPAQTYYYFDSANKVRV